MSTLKRIKEYIDYKGITNQKFEKRIGFSNGAFASQLKNNRTIGVDKLENILKEFPEINAEWLLTGLGNMTKVSSQIVAEEIPSYRKTKDALYESQSIPLYNLEATMGLVPLIANNGPDSERIIDYLSIPNLPSCDGSIYATGDSMYPLLKAGDIVAYKTIPVNLDQIFFGEIYVLAIYLDEDTTFKTIKFVKHSELGPEYIKLVSQNQHHADKDIKLSQISAMALVRASVRIQN